MKCGLFNDPFDYYGHIGSRNGDRVYKFAGEWCGGWVGDETMKDDTFNIVHRNHRSEKTSLHCVHVWSKKYTKTHKLKNSLTEKVNVDLVQIVHAAELIEFVVNFVVDESPVVVRCVIFHDIVDWSSQSKAQSNKTHGRTVVQTMNSVWLQSFRANGSCTDFK